MWSEFAEKQFENVMNQELKAMTTDQVAEAVLGYDAFANPGAAHRIWRYLGVARPKGLVLKPSFWPSTRQPRQAQIGLQQTTNLILQYKRCEYMMGPNAGQSWLWNGDPYYRLRVTDHQQTALAHLEWSLGKNAAIRYAAPAFHTAQELSDHFHSKTGLRNTGFVAPSGLQGHRYWTYQAPGTTGIANPRLELPFQDFAGLMDELLEVANLELKESVMVVANAMANTAIYLLDGEFEANRAEHESRQWALESESPAQSPIAEDQHQIQSSPTNESREYWRRRLAPDPPDGIEFDNIDMESLVALRTIISSAAILGVEWMPCLTALPEQPAV